ncbi:hypothetical protein [Nonomuraea africana]|uniref:Uncharacterized protein n=1 Tax=Nonomuraea africana TaxID=46171 RepID=A0ABR9K8E5_9ACTN|nr:hypothetical protein [Nonomuraea africana]MBE1558071.1 hypothetical protein [Nonomuraea africana]
MPRGLSSRSVSLGALVTLSAVVLTGCASPDVSDGTTARPRDSYVVTTSGEELTRAGKISTNGFGNRTSTGS